MPTVYRVCKARHPVFDGIGAYLEGGRWNSPGRPVIYASTCLAGSILEIIAHAGRRLHLPGPHHGARAFIPDDLRRERLEVDGLAGWADEESRSAREYGDAWLLEGRTAVLFVPAVTAQPFGSHVLLNPRHPEYRRIRFEEPRPVAWDARLFRL